MATHAGVALELGITRPGTGAGGLKMMSPQMEAILIWCQCRTRNYKIKLENFTSDWASGEKPRSKIPLMQSHLTQDQMSHSGLA